MSVVPASVSPSTRDLEWAAGFLEGEGTFFCANRSHGIQVSQVNGEPLGRLKKLFGGYISLLQGKGPKQNDFLKWSACGARARGVMMTLYPLLSQKRQGQILKALTANTSRKRT
jgi:hypothetical protein